ncbi:hypothetical protein M3J09_008698 [Ascochyta lentis]
MDVDRALQADAGAARATRAAPPPARAAPSASRVPAELAPDGPANQSLRARRSSSQPSSVRTLPLSVDTTATATTTTTSARPPRKKRSPNAVRAQAASPELISSLIDQLSAISASTQHHFETLPAAYSPSLPAAAAYSPPPSASRQPSPSPHAARSSRSSLAALHHAPAADRSPYSSAIREQNDLFPDDACEPPVVRTSKPPSGKSPITAPPKSKTRRDKTHSLTTYIGRSAGSSASIHSCHSARSSLSFGNISIEAAKPVAVAVVAAGTRSNRSSAESKRSVKRPRSLMYMSSRERLKQKEVDHRKRLDDTASPDEPRKPASQLFSYEDTIKEEPLTRDDHDHHHHHHHHDRDHDRDHNHNHNHDDNHDSFALHERASFPVQHHPSRNPSPARRIRMNLVDGPNGESPSEQGLIPDRGSSLRHGSPSKKSRKSSASKSRDKGKENERPKTIAVSVPEEPNMDPEEARKHRLLMELEQEENEVAQRIKQLREQKLLREKRAGKQPADSAGGAAVVKPPVSGLPSPEASPPSTAGPTSEERALDCTKAHKLLGIPAPPAGRSSTESDLNKPLPSIEPREPTRPPPLPPRLRHARHRSLTVNDGDDLPLPINYALALQSLDESAPNSPLSPRLPQLPQLPQLPRTRMTSPPPSISTSSTRETSAPRDTLKRSSSLSVGGRSAVSRKAVSTAMHAPKGHKHSASLTEDRPPVFRSASEDIPSGRHSSLSTASAANSFSLQQKRTLKKKRWSHPDLPAKAEKAHNDKVDAAEAAEARAAQARAQNPWSPVIEERPTSLDSVDMDVDAYLDAPRLSQKIRHPQTGRIISFSEVGDPNGYAVFVCVGMGLTRFVMAFYDQLAATLKLRLITPERPGIGGSQADPNGTPLTWPDDVLIICQALRITKFSLLAHSAGAIYALATSLRMPQHIRGRVHLLAPWIPPSQMAPIGIGRESPPTQQLPRSQRFLRALPVSLLKVANSTFLSGTSASIQRTGPKQSPRTRRKSTAPQAMSHAEAPPPRPLLKDNRRESMLMMDQVLPNASSLTLTVSNSIDPLREKARLEALSLAERERQHAYDERLTFAIWDRATANANPATDLIVCLETKQPIGFRYEDINRPVVIHHGSKDSRVPVDNVRWLGKLMRKCEVRVLDGEPHGLMASAHVMGNVLTEMAGDWEDWTAVVKQASVSDLRSMARRKAGYT